VGKIQRSGLAVLTTRLSAEKIAALQTRFPLGRANSAGRTFTVNAPKPKPADCGEPFVAILAAGTSDFPVAEEAVEVCVAMGVAFEKIYDVGVSGLHRLLNRIESVQQASALVVIAGMEGRCPAWCGTCGAAGFCGANQRGLRRKFWGRGRAACDAQLVRAGVTVVNIDNGFSAAYAACNVARLIREARTS